MVNVRTFFSQKEKICVAKFENDNTLVRHRTSWGVVELYLIDTTRNVLSIQLTDSLRGGL